MLSGFVSLRSSKLELQGQSGQEIDSRLGIIPAPSIVLTAGGLE
jgi:hypothetical protein